ncbi:MAG: universal stress protein [Planctomycetota bacterium]
MPAKACLLNIVEYDSDFPNNELESQDTSDHGLQELSQQHKDLQEKADKLRKSGTDTKGLLTQGSVVEVILHKSKQLEIDIIIVGTHGHGGVHHMIFGSFNEGVLRNASCPVLVIPTLDRK